MSEAPHAPVASRKRNDRKIFIYQKQVKIEKGRFYLEAIV